MKSVVMSAACVLFLSGVCIGRQADTPQVHRPGDGVTAPRLVSDVKPSYTPEAIRAGVRGSVMLECVVDAEGAVGDVRVLKSLHPELDAESTRALKQWRFEPGMKDGKRVAVLVEVEMTFTLRRKGPPLGSPEVYLPGAEGVSLPRAVREVQPAYPAAARAEGVQGTVILEAVVLPDGTVGDARVTGPLDPALEAEAMKALNDWRFEPGRKDGRAVPVQALIEMRFALR